MLCLKLRRIRGVRDVSDLWEIAQELCEIQVLGLLAKENDS